MLAEFLAGGNIGKMDLHGGDANGLERVENGDAGVSVGGGIYHNTLYLSVCFLNAVDDRSLVIGLEKVQLYIFSGAVLEN